jgi:hypothetical protein
MKKMTTGDDATLANYRKLTELAFGEESPAVKFLDQRIAEQGADAEVQQDERQVMRLLLEMHRTWRDDLRKRSG